jgi:hypothetical protein
MTGIAFVELGGSPKGGHATQRGVGRTIREDSDVQKSAHQTCHPFCSEISLELPTLR